MSNTRIRKAARKAARENQLAALRDGRKCRAATFDDRRAKRARTAARGRTYRGER